VCATEMTKRTDMDALVAEVTAQPKTENAEVTA
jgi:hypothetical protein